MTNWNYQHTWSYFSCRWESFSSEVLGIFKVMCTCLVFDKSLCLCARLQQKWPTRRLGFYLGIRHCSHQVEGVKLISQQNCSVIRCVMSKLADQGWEVTSKSQLQLFQIQLLPQNLERLSWKEPRGGRGHSVPLTFHLAIGLQPEGLEKGLVPGPGGYLNYFLTRCAARGLKPLPISKDFSPSKNSWFNSFFFSKNFRKLGAISKGFSTSKMADFSILAIFVKWDPLLRFFFFLEKWDPCLRIFAEKVTHLGGTSPYALTCESLAWGARASELTISEFGTL